MQSHMPHFYSRRTNSEDTRQAKFHEQSVGLPKQTNAARASHPSRIRSRNSHRTFPGSLTAGQRYRSDSAPLGVLLLPVRAAKSRFKEPLSRNLCDGQRPNLLPEQEAEEAAMPGQPARARAHFRFPPAIHPRELPAATSVTAFIVWSALRVPTFRWTYSLA